MSHLDEYNTDVSNRFNEYITPTIGKCSLRFIESFTNFLVCEFHVLHQCPVFPVLLHVLFQTLCGYQGISDSLQIP